MRRSHTAESIKRKLITITLAFTLLSAAFISTYSYISYRGILQRSLKQTTTDNLKLLAETIQFELDIALNLADICAANTAVISWLEESNQSSDGASEAAYLAWKRVEEEKRNNQSRFYINRVLISDKYNRYIMLQGKETTHNYPIAKMIQESSFFQKLCRSERYIETGFIEDPLIPFVEKNQVLPVIRPVYSFFGQREVGWCCLFLSPDLFTDHMRNYPLEEDNVLYLFLGDTFYCWDGKNLMKTDSPEQPDKLISYKPDGQNWYLSQQLSQTALIQQTKVYLFTLVVLAAAVIGFGFAIALYYHHLINIPIQKILKKLQLVSKGDFSPEPDIEWKNELGEIGRGINAMSKNIMQLIQTHTEDQKRKDELEYEILQHQINPHFLYNTLNAISWMAKIQGTKGIMEMTDSLSLLLKAISKKSGAVHSLREEMTLLQHYFLIMKYRYGGGLSLHTDVEQDELLEAMVPKLVLQIVVENAIFHGIEPKGTRGMIRICIRQSDDKKDLLLFVTDNGIGMTKEQIQKMLSQTSDFSGLFRKIGIHNLQERIQYIYGDHYGITIESLQNEYTTVVIKLPFRKEAAGCV